MAGKVMARDPSTGKFRWMERAAAEANNLEIKEAFGGRFGARSKPRGGERPAGGAMGSSGDPRRPAVTGATQAATPVPPTPAARKPSRAGGRGDVVAIGNLAWGFLSLPIGIASPSAGQVMREQVNARPNAGQQIDTLLKGTMLYDALTSDGKSEKAMAAFYLGAPVLLSIVGDAAWSRMQADPGNIRARAMVGWLQGMTRQVLESQGIHVPEPPPAPEARSEPTVSGPPPPPPPPAPEPPPSAATNGQLTDAAAVAAAAAEASRFDAVE